MIDEIELSTILYWNDPAHTSCKENDIEDEYDGFASAVAREVEDRGEDIFIEVLMELYVEFFGVEVERDVATKIVREYYNNVAAGD